jgi:hypothetical protein
VSTQGAVAQAPRHLPAWLLLDARRLEVANQPGAADQLLCAQALAEHLDSRSGERITAQLNQVYGASEVSAQFDPALSQAQFAALADEAW